jgi:hypothetical protein
VTPAKSSPSIKRLSPAELQARREKGLCYNCDERFVRGHRCKHLFNLLIVGPEISMDEGSTLQTLESEDQIYQDPIEDPTPDPAQISFHALMGHTIPQTLRVMGQINHNPVAILIDSGSTHNFLQDRVAK